MKPSTINTNGSAVSNSHLYTVDHLQSLCRHENRLSVYSATHNTASANLAGAGTVAHSEQHHGPVLLPNLPVRGETYQYSSSHAKETLGRQLLRSHHYKTQYTLRLEN